MFWQNLCWRWREYLERRKWDALHPSWWEPMKSREEILRAWRHQRVCVGLPTASKVEVIR